MGRTLWHLHHTHICSWFRFFFFFVAFSFGLQRILHFAYTIGCVIQRCSCHSIKRCGQSYLLRPETATDRPIWMGWHVHHKRIWNSIGCDRSRSWGQRIRQLWRFEDPNVRNRWRWCASIDCTGWRTCERVTRPLCCSRFDWWTFNGTFLLLTFFNVQSLRAFVRWKILFFFVCLFSFYCFSSLNMTTFSVK